MGGGQLSERKGGKGETAENFHKSAQYSKAFCFFLFTPGLQEDRYPSCQIGQSRERDKDRVRAIASEWLSVFETGSAVQSILV